MKIKSFGESGCLARSATKAPKVKKLSFAGEKELLPKLREKLLFALAKTCFFIKGLEWKAGSGFKKKLQIDAA